VIGINDAYSKLEEAATCKLLINVELFLSTFWSLSSPDGGVIISLISVYILSHVSSMFSGFGGKNPITLISKDLFYFPV